MDGEVDDQAIINWFYACHCFVFGILVLLQVLLIFLKCNLVGYYVNILIMKWQCLWLVSFSLLQADGLHAEARVAVPGEHRGILCEPHVFRIVKHWLKAGAPDPFYNPINDYVILPTAFEMESHHDKGLQVTSLKEEWEIVSEDQDNLDDVGSGKPFVSSISVSGGGNKQSSTSKAHATVIFHPQNEGKQHVELNAVSVSVDA